MRRLVLVDDEPRVARALEYALTGRDIDVQAVNNPADLETSITASVPDAILLDIEVGTYDGLALCRQLRADARLEQVPVLLLSGHTDAATKRAGLDAGADDFVAKPFVPDELLARIESQLRRRSRA
jgi:DNA-binding response OmpR family regulator